jgi:outer membrane protein assembly factor BamB
MKHPFYFALALAFTLLGSLAQAARYDWPQWRGPNRDGISPETGLLRQWPDGGPPRLWRAEGLGPGDGSVVMQGDRIFVQGTHGNDGVLICLNREDGALLWRTPLGPQFIHGNNPGESSTPAIDGDRVYALSGHGVVLCANVADGKPLWFLDLRKEFNGRSGNWGFSESPLVEGDMLIVSPGGPRATIVALNKFTGETIWTTRTLSDVGGYASPIAVDLGSMRVIVAFTARAGVGVDAANGNLLWRYTPPANRTANAATPVFHNNRVFYSSDYGTGGGLLEVAPVNDRVLTREIYFNKVMKNHFGNVILLDGYLYGSSGVAFACMHFETGKAAWQDRSIGKSSIAYADGHLYLMSDRGIVGLLEATPEAHRLVSKFKLDTTARNTRTVPVICDGRLYIRHGDRLDCHDIRAATP